MPEGNIHIVIRVKPCPNPSSTFQLDTTEKEAIWDLSQYNSTYALNSQQKRQSFHFDDLLDQTISQDSVFERVARPVADTALTGYNGTIFAYGQSGSGKTFTITGGTDRYEDRGIIPRTLNHIFSRINEDTSRQYSVFVSYLEIYMDNGYDLLSPKHENCKSLSDLDRVYSQEDEDGNVHLRNIDVHPVSGVDDALNLLFVGDTNRAVGSTTLNMTSSRSHCIFTIYLKSQEKDSAMIQTSKLNLVDLAGSERIYKTNTDGKRLEESKEIMKSLYYLERVIMALSERNRKQRSHIPYRDCLLTNVLRDSLGGNCKTTMIATITPEDRYIDESISTCKFAMRVGSIENVARLNQEADPRILVRRLKGEIANLKAELLVYKGEVSAGYDLTPGEDEELRARVNAYVGNVSEALDLGEFSFVRIRRAFEMMKEMIQRGGKADPSQFQHERNELEEKASALEQQIHDRDVEISILVDMIRKGQIVRPEGSSAAQLPLSLGPLGSSSLPSPAAPSGASLPSSSSSSSSDLSMVPTPGYSGPGGFLVEAEFLNDKDRAFEKFRSMYPPNASFETSKLVLQEKYGVAKELGARVNESRNQINYLKSSIEQIRMESAVSGLSDDTDPGVSAEESEKLSEIDRLKEVYREGFGALKELKREIEGIQNLMETTRRRMQADFNSWFKSLEAYYSTERDPSRLNRSLRQALDVDTQDDIVAFSRARDELLRRAHK